ncbi:MAG: APC family permease [Candidatus Marinimicrobia bacterium]|nr:APC family permease [Candidatus Neomarinimicrobiota bacterium]MCF7828297.1 APC family permease [Candidatus Neomarinimicrobiota bacterium]MCF7879528.1 APC family permease [Candidatus Neomarinimicrobiota bacterium]
MFSVLNAIAIIVGIVIGIGIFRLPPLVASNAGNGTQFLLTWILGGAISLIGALCYAELATAHPDAGGEYHFLRKAYGDSISFLFSWGRMTVIQTGSIALAAFILGEYATLILDLGSYSAPIYAVLTILILTGLNIWGTSPSKQAQNIMTGMVVLVLISIAVLGIVVAAPGESGGTEAGGAPLQLNSAGLAMIFVLLSYGGWSEAAYLSAELKNVRQNMARVLVLAIGLITILYLMINYSYLNVLGFEGLQSSQTVGSDLTKHLFGPRAEIFMALLVVFTAASTANASIITGARTNYAMGRDFPFLGFLGKWSSRQNSPVNSLIIQGLIALALVLIGTLTRESISTIVEYTAPVFWFFLMLTGVTLFVFRYRDGLSDGTYRVPLYPVTPILFIATCLILFYSSITVTGIGALLGIGILLLGIPFLLIGNRNIRR